MLQKLGACRGLMAMMRLLPHAWVRKRDVDWMKAFLFIIKDSPAHISVYLLEETEAALHLFVRILQLRAPAPVAKPAASASTPTTPATQTEAANKKEIEILSLLICELSSPNENVRRVVQSLLAVIVEMTGKSVPDLLSASNPSTGGQVIYASKPSDCLL